MDEHREHALGRDLIRHVHIYMGNHQDDTVNHALIEQGLDVNYVKQERVFFPPFSSEMLIARNQKLVES